MDFKNINAQLKLSEKAIQEYKKQNRIFEQILSEAIKGAPEKDKSEIQKVKSFTEKVKGLVKEGKLEEAQTLIKNYTHGR